MTTPQIFKKLKLYLPESFIIRLKLDYSLPPSILICMTINDIVKGYNADQETEDAVEELLINLCKNHFNKKK